MADQAMYRGKVSGKNVVYSLTEGRCGDVAETTGGERSTGRGE